MKTSLPSQGNRPNSTMFQRLRLGAVLICISEIRNCYGSSPCLTADAMIGGMRQYFTDWDQQLVEASNSTWNCKDFAQFLYNSRDRIHTELQYTYGNMTTFPAPPEVEDRSVQSDSELTSKDGQVQTQETQPPPGFGEVHWIMSHVNQAASLVSAAVHVNSGLGVIRGECFTNPAVHLLFFVTLRRIHQLSLNQLKYLWYMFQNTPEMYRGASSQWLQEATQVFMGDLDTTESIFGGWNPPNITMDNRTENDILRYNKYERPGVLSIIELLRKMTFQENKYDKEFVRVMMRYIWSKNDLLLELGAGTGDMSTWLNETGWVQSHAYDYTSDIGLITFGKVRKLGIGIPPPKLGNNDVPYDWIICINIQCLEMLQTIEDSHAMNSTGKTFDMITKGIVLDKTVMDTEKVIALFDGKIYEDSTAAKVLEERNNMHEKYVVLRLTGGLQ